MLHWLRISWSLFDFVVLLVFACFLLVTETRLKWTVIRKKKVVEPAPSPPSDKPVRATKTLTVRDVPGPVAIPILGTRWIFTKFGPYELGKIHEAYRDMYNRYGSIFREEALWNFPVVSVVDTDSIQKVLKQSGKYPLRPPTELTAMYRSSRPDRYTNLGLVNEQGETWHHLRSLLTPELTSAKTVSRFLPEQNSITDDFLSLLRSMRDTSNQVDRFEELANRMGLEVTCSLMLGRRMGFLNEKVDPIAARLAAAVKVHFCASRDTFYGLPFWKTFPSQTWNDFVDSEETIYEIISEMVESALEDESNTAKISSTQSVFMSILQTHGLDIRDKKAAIIDFIAAGIQTLGNTLVFILYLLAKNPKVQEKLREELANVMIKGGDVSQEALKKTSYLKACITEGFRMLPTAPCVARILESPLKLGPYDLQSGTVVLCHTWMACMEDKNFVRSKEFEPERWLGDEGRANPFLVVPFGCGKRMCPGKRFIEQELHVILAKIVTEFQLEFDGELGLQFEFLLAPKGPVKLRIIDRD